MPDARWSLTGSTEGQLECKHGRYTAEAIANQRQLSALLATMKALAAEVTE
jgi:hypothetical protein